MYIQMKHPNVLDPNFAKGTIHEVVRVAATYYVVRSGGRDIHVASSRATVIDDSPPAVDTTTAEPRYDKLNPQQELRKLCLVWAFKRRELMDVSHMHVTNVAEEYYRWIVQGKNERVG